MLDESPEARVERLVLDFAQSVPTARPLNPHLSLRDDLVIESLSLVSLTVQLGDELGVNVMDAGVDLGALKTVGDLITMARSLSHWKNHQRYNRSASP